MKKNDKIWDVCRDVTTENGKTISGLRDLFDIYESTYSNTTIQEKVEIIRHICKNAECSFSDIYAAFNDCYDNENYKHIKEDVYAGIFRIYRFLCPLEQNGKSDNDIEELVDSLIAVFRNNKTPHITEIRGILSSGSYSDDYYDLIFNIWPKKDKASICFFISEIVQLIDNILITAMKK